jgi:hypothetical protein
MIEKTSTDTLIIHGAISGEKRYKTAENRISMPDIWNILSFILNKNLI